MGDATAEMRTVAEESAVAYSSTGGSKPWWWFPTLMPVWVAIASAGASSTRTFLAELHAGQGEPLRGPSRDDDEVIGPRKRDYVMSIVFIVFGVAAATFGVISNIYVQVNGIFFSPH